MNHPDSEANFKKVERNPLQELAKLRLEIAPAAEDFDINCQLRFSAGEVCVSGREYTVGITEARLQLSLEGCETVMGCDYGNSELPKLHEESTITTQAQISGAAGVAPSMDGIALPSIEAKAGAERMYQHVVKQSNTVLPMVALSGDAWRIKRTESSGKGGDFLEGSAIDGHRLCRVARKAGGNRLGIVAELQVRRSKIWVKPTKGNRMGKLFSVTRNKDAVVAKVLEKALRREASSSIRNSSTKAVAAARTELLEE